MKKLLLILLIAVAQHLHGKTLTSVAIFPPGLVIQYQISYQLTVTCTYDDRSTDNCASVNGGITWKSGQSKITVVNGLVRGTADPGAKARISGTIQVFAGGMTDRIGVYVQHPGDVWYLYPTPDWTHYKQNGTAYTPTLAVGATTALGEAYATAGGGWHTGTPINAPCTWTSSDTTKVVVDRGGHATGIAPTGSAPVTVTCNLYGDGGFATTNSVSGWLSPGNFSRITVVNGGTSNKTWYVRHDGGRRDQCDGLHDQSYAAAVRGPVVTARWMPNSVMNIGDQIAQKGRIYQVTVAGTTGSAAPGLTTTANGTSTDGTVTWKNVAAYPTNRACAFDNLRDLWADEVTYNKAQWIISGGDTVIVRQNPDGYNIGGDYKVPNNFGANLNCLASCPMPTIPSGTAERHTRILGENWQACHSDAAKTQLWQSWGAYTGINISDSQFVDAQCFRIAQKASCITQNNYTHHCTAADNFGSKAIFSSAYSSNDNVKDVYVDGIGGNGWYGAVGVGVAVDYLHVRGTIGGINMDDLSWTSGNISTAGGFSMTNSTVEFSGCVVEYPQTHAYPFLECRDEGGGSDGFGTASTSGDWYFDHDVFFANMSDGFDLLHSGMDKFTFTNSISAASSGAAIKMGSGKQVLIRNNLFMANCDRTQVAFGDEPNGNATAVPGTFIPCRAGAGIGMPLDAFGTTVFDHNTFLVTHDTPLEIVCSGGDDCTHNQGTFTNNIVVGVRDKSPNLTNSGSPALFYSEGDKFLTSADGAIAGWRRHSNNIFYNVRQGWCPTGLGPTEKCSQWNGTVNTNSAADPKLANEILSITSESQLDVFNPFDLSHQPVAPSGWLLSSTSRARNAGFAQSGVTTDFNGFNYASPPSLGALEYQSSAPPLTVNKIINSQINKRAAIK
jgi:hypothetical protein